MKFKELLNEKTDYASQVSNNLGPLLKNLQKSNTGVTKIRDVFKTVNKEKKDKELTYKITDLNKIINDLNKMVDSLSDIDDFIRDYSDEDLY